MKISNLLGHSFKIQATGHEQPGKDQGTEIYLWHEQEVQADLQQSGFRHAGGCLGKHQVQVHPEYSRQYPDEAQTASQLSGIVSHETQLGILSAVDNVKEELERIEKEQDQEGYETDYPTNRTADDVQADLYSGDVGL